MLKKLGLALGLTMPLFTTGCGGALFPKQVPLVHSSLDFNQSAPQKTAVKDTDLPALVTRVTVLAEKRNLLLVAKNCSDAACDFSFKAKPETLSKTVGQGSSWRGTGSSSVHTYNLSFSSRFFGRVSRTQEGALLEMVGVPVINETLSCPAVLAQQDRCKTAMFNVRGNQTPAESFKGIWGVDISGKSEAEVISGIFAEL